MYKTKGVKTIALKSATVTHLIYSIITAVMVFMLECVVIWHCFFRAEIAQDVGVLIIVQIPVLLISLVPITHIPAYKNRQPFVLYFSRLEYADMTQIKNKYHICHIDDYGVIFVKNKDARLFDSWSLLYDIASTREIEMKLFDKG